MVFGLRGQTYVFPFKQRRNTCAQEDSEIFCGCPHERNFVDGAILARSFSERYLKISGHASTKEVKISNSLDNTNIDVSNVTGVTMA